MIMISMPMGNDPNWKEKYNKVKAKLKSKGYKVTPLHINKIFDKVPTVLYPVKSIPLLMMGNALYRLAISDSIYMCKGWESARGCFIEREAAIRYGLNVIYEDNEDEN